MIITEGDRIRPGIEARQGAPAECSMGAAILRTRSSAASADRAGGFLELVRRG